MLAGHLLGWTTIGYVEIDKYCQQVIAQRIKDEIFKEAPIFTDVREFIQSGAADEYEGVTDVVTAGFPCQPFSVAGKGKGKDDSRNLWPETVEIIRRVRPRYAFLENVPGLLTHKYIGRIFGELAEAGYDARWCVLGADDVGAPHHRKRLWILAYSISEYERMQSSRQRDGWKSDNRQERYKMGDFSSGLRDKSGTDVSDSGSSGLERRQSPIRTEKTHAGTSDPCRWPVEPDVGRVANGVASRANRLKAIGNGQVPAVAATAWKILSEPNKSFD